MVRTATHTATRTATRTVAVAVVIAGLLGGCGGSSSSGAFCSASASLTAAGTAIQRSSPDDLAQVKAQVAALLPTVQRAQAKAPKAIHEDVDLLGNAFEQFATAVSSAATKQDLIGAFTAYNQRTGDLSDAAQRVNTWVTSHCSSPAAPASSG